MASQPTFVRLVDGRLWHVRLGSWATVCGRIIDAPIVDADARFPEELQGVVPTGAWVCTRCRATLADWLAAVDQAIKADPRHRRGEPLPDADAIADFLDAADAEADRFERTPQ